MTKKKTIHDFHLMKKEGKKDHFPHVVRLSHRAVRGGGGPGHAPGGRFAGHVRVWLRGHGACHHGPDDLSTRRRSAAAPPATFVIGDMPFMSYQS